MYKRFHNRFNTLGPFFELFNKNYYYLWSRIDNQKEIH